MLIYNSEEQSSRIFALARSIKFMKWIGRNPSIKEKDLKEIVETVEVNRGRIAKVRQFLCSMEKENNKLEEFVNEALAEVK